MSAFCGMNIPSFSEDSTDTLLQLSPTDSNGQQSNCSIPWAEDAILDNKEEWEKIDRIFHGEEELPLDKPTREEFLEWMTAFPHLRIVARSMNYYFDDRVKPSDEKYEEIFAIDPGLANPLEIECKKLSLNERRNQLKIDEESAKMFELRETANDFNKYLRIASSGPMVGRQHPTLTYLSHPQQPYYHSDYIEKIKTYELNTADSVFGRYIPPIQPRIYDKTFSTNIYSARLAPLELNITKIPFTLISSSDHRMTPVISLQFIEGDVGKKSKMHSSSATRRLVKLPTLNTSSQKFQNEVVGRSISAVNRSVTNSRPQSRHIVQKVGGEGGQQVGAKVKK